MRSLIDSEGDLLPDGFWSWFGDSKCVDDDGNPKVFYHGSNVEFSRFNLTRIGTRGAGIYFALDKEEALLWAKRYEGSKVCKVYIRSDNPYIDDKHLDSMILFQLFSSGGESTDESFGRDLKNCGYDSFWVTVERKTVFGVGLPEIVVYSPDQVLIKCWE